MYAWVGICSWEGRRRGLLLLLLQACANQAQDKGGIVYDEVTHGGNKWEMEVQRDSRVLKNRKNC